METASLPQSADYRQSLNRHVAAVIPVGSHCLDVGCWNGNLGKYLIEQKHCIVDGVDAVPTLLKEARRNGYSEVYSMNLNEGSLNAGAIIKKYDCIIFADVLEHLVQPEKVLHFFAQFLSVGGCIVVSLPNVAFFMNRLRLLLGDWEYRDFGTLDKTHLRFFTLKSSKELLESAGFQVKQFRPYNQFGILKYFDPPVFPGLLAYQVLLVAKKVTDK